MGISASSSAVPGLNTHTHAPNELRGLITYEHTIKFPRKMKTEKKFDQNRTVKPITHLSKNK